MTFIAFNPPEETPITIKGIVASSHKALLRNDNQMLLNICSKDYNVCTNEYLKDVVGRLGELTSFNLEGYEEWNGGKKVMAFLKNTNKLSKIGDWDVQDYMIIGNGHDYSFPFFVGTSSEMIRCSNQFSQIHKMMRVPHVKSQPQKIETMVRYISDYVNYRSEMYKNIEKFIPITVDPVYKAQFTNQLLGIEAINGIVQVEMSPRKLIVKSQLEEAIEKETGELGNNLFGLWNGMTYYTTHIKKTKSHIFGNVFGVLAETNEKGYRLLQKRYKEVTE